MARRCVFCDSTGKLTREHVIPEWFSDLVQLPAGYVFEMGHRDRENDGLRVRVNREIDIVTKAVCGPCNYGWMSDLEKQVKPVLLPLLHGQPVSLTRTDMDLIALWATKTAMTSALASPQYAAVTPIMLRWLYDHRQPLPFSGVWIGRFLGRVGAPLAAEVIPRQLHAHDDARGKRFGIYDWTAVLGHLVIKVMMLPEYLWTLRGTVSFDEPKPLVPMYGGLPHLPAYEWPPSHGYVEAEVIALSYALSGSRLQLNPAEA